MSILCSGRLLVQATPGGDPTIKTEFNLVGPAQFQPLPVNVYPRFAYATPSVDGVGSWVQGTVYTVTLLGLSWQATIGQVVDSGDGLVVQNVTLVPEFQPVTGPVEDDWATVVIPGIAAYAGGPASMSFSISVNTPASMGVKTLVVGEPVPRPHVGHHRAPKPEPFKGTSEPRYRDWR